MSHGAKELPYGSTILSVDNGKLYVSIFLIIEVLHLEKMSATILEN